MRDWRLVLRDMEREEERKRSMVKIVPGELRNQKCPCGSVAVEKLKIASAICSRGRKMPDEIETIDKNPKSWAAWKREAERLQAIIDDMALAAMDSEPVAEVLSNRPGNDTSTIDRALPVGTQLYRHAQPAPVVPEEKSIPNTLSMYAVDAVAAIAEVKGWNACRAAMLHAGNSPAIPDGYVMVPKEPTREMLDEFDSIIDYGAEDSVDAWRRLLAAAPQEVKGE